MARDTLNRAKKEESYHSLQYLHDCGPPHASFNILTSAPDSLPEESEGGS